MTGSRPAGGPARRIVHVPRERLPRWVGGFLDRHGSAVWRHDGTTVVVTAADGAEARLDALDPAGSEGVGSLRTLVGWPGRQPRLALVLARRGRYAVGLADDDALLSHRSGSRYVQSRTAAGGWSQQRYQRRRGNQADALVDHVARTLVEHLDRVGGPRWAGGLVLGGDRALAAAVVAHPRLAPLRDLPRHEAHGVPDPTLAVLQAVLAEARAVRVTITDPPPVRETTRGTVAPMRSTAICTARELLPAAAAAVTDLVEALPEEAWDRPSPCEGWTVRDVLAHLAAEHLWAPRLLGGETLQDVGDDYDGEVLGADPVAAWGEAAERSVRAWSEPLDEERHLQMSSGPCSVGEYAQQMLVDLTVHLWDLSRGAGLPARPVPEAVAECLRYETPRVEAGGVDGIFAAPVPTSSKDRWDQLVAMLGRDPRWRP